MKALFSTIVVLSLHIALLLPRTYGQITEGFEDEGPSVPIGSYLRNFSQGGISFTSSGKLVVFGNTGSAWGASGSFYYLHTEPSLSSADGVGTITITTPATSFRIISFAAYVSTDMGGNTPSSGDVTFKANLASGGVASETITVNSTTQGSGYDISNTFTGALNTDITSLTITLSSGLKYIDLDNIVFTTAPLAANQYSISDVTKLEGNAGTTSFNFTVSRTQTQATGSVQVSTTNGTATSPTDFTALSTQTINFAIGESSKNVSVVVNGDTSPESDELFTVNLANPVNGVILRGTGVGTIKDDDSITENFENEITDSQNFTQNGINFSSTGSLVISPNGGAGSGGTLDTRIGNGGTASGIVGTFGITTTATSFNMISIEMFASNDDGYNPKNGTVTFTGTKADGTGTITHAATFTASGDNFTLVNFAGTPFANVQLTSVSISTSTGLNYIALDNLKFGTGTIVIPQVSINDVTITEGTGPGNTDATFTVTRTTNTTALSVTVSLNHVTSSNNDLLTTFPPTTLNFTAGGELTKSVTVPINRDNVAEPNEIFNLVLSNATNGYAILDGLGIGTINDDDGIVETFEGETNNALTFSQNGINFNSSGHLKVRNASNFGSGSSHFFLDTGIGNGPTPIGSAGSLTITTPNLGFKVIAIDVWTSNNDGAVNSQSASSIKFKGTKSDGTGTVEVTKAITPSGDIPGGWVQNVSFSSTPLEGVALNGLEILIVSGANYVSLDNFSYVTVNTDPEIEIVDASNTIIATGSSSPAMGTGAHFGEVCMNTPNVSKTFTIKNIANIGSLALSGSPIITISGAGASFFTVTTQPSSTVSAGQSTTFQISYAPTAVGTHDAQINIVNNDLNENPFTFAIRGITKAIPSAIITAVSQVCQTTSLSLSVPSAGTGATYTWAGHGLVPTNTNSIVAVPVLTGSQNYTVTVQYPNGCSASSSKIVLVNTVTLPSTPNTATVNIGPEVITSDNCEFLAKITSSGSNPVSGSVKISQWQETSGFSMVPRHYEITPLINPETATGTISLYFTQDDFDAYNLTLTTGFLPANPTQNTENVEVVRYAGVSLPNDGLPAHYTAQPSTIVPNSVVWNDVLSLWEVTFDVTAGFSGFFVKSTSQSLPLKLVSFKGTTISSEENKLTWVTIDEDEFSHFEIMRSIDARSFETIGLVQGKSSTTSQLQVYEFYDRNTNNKMYYRLTMVDLDGSITRSNIISVGSGDIASTFGSIYPNPIASNETASIDIFTEKDAVWTIEIFDLLGRCTHRDKQPLKRGYSTLNLSQFTKGINLIKLTNGSETVIKRVIKH